MARLRLWLLASLAIDAIDAYGGWATNYNWGSTHYCRRVRRQLDVVEYDANLSAALCGSNYSSSLGKHSCSSRHRHRWRLSRET